MVDNFQTDVSKELERRQTKAAPASHESLASLALVQVVRAEADN